MHDDLDNTCWNPASGFLYTVGSRTQFLSNKEALSSVASHEHIRGEGYEATMEAGAWKLEEVLG